MTQHLIAPPGARHALSWSMSESSKFADSSGDGYMLLRDGAHIRIYVVDGMGSGAEANAAADTTLAHLREAGGYDMEIAFDQVHAALRGIRGVALAAAQIDLEQMMLSWSAVGDIDGVLVRNGRISGSLIQKSGTLGLIYDGIRLTSAPLRVDDVIILATDGISRTYRSDLDATHPISDITSGILRHHGRPTDDRLVLGLKVVAAP